MVVNGSLKIWSHFENTRVARDDHAPALVTLGQEGEEHLHLLPVLLHIANVAEHDDGVAVQLLERRFQRRAGEHRDPLS